MKAAIGLLLLVVAGPAQGSPARIISQGATRGHLLALTFDAGADRGYALRILQTLERNHLHATFGMTGRWAESNGDLIRRMRRDHDPFINHTYDHRSFTGVSTHLAPLTTAQRTWEITHTDRIIQRLTGQSTKPYFRPPYGDYDPATPVLAGRLGYRYMIMWTVDSLGWEGLSAAAIVQRCLELASAGAILLMHVGSQSQDAFALQPIITQLERRGYRFVTVPQLVAAR